MDYWIKILNNENTSNYKKYIAKKYTFFNFDIYTKEFAFYKIQEIKFKRMMFDIDMEKQVYYALINSGLKNSEDYIIKQPNRDEIMDNADILVKLYNIKKKIKEIDRIALKLYNKTKTNIDKKYVPGPTNWLNKQDDMRQLWSTLKNNYKDKYLFNNEYSEYMDFMYKNYPKNYGNLIQNEEIRKEEIYYNLI